MPAGTAAVRPAQSGQGRHWREWLRYTMVAASVEEHPAADLASEAVTEAAAEVQAQPWVSPSAVQTILPWHLVRHKGLYRFVEE